MMRWARLGALFTVLAALAPAPGRADSAGLVFAQRTVASAEQVEPLLAVGSGASPMIYYGIPVEHRIWRSANGGTTWTQKATPPSVSGSGSSTGNSTVAVDAAGSVYIANPEGGHYPEVAYTSLSQGDTWTNGAYVGRGRICENDSDRTWTAAGVSGRVMHVAPCTTADAARFPEQDIYGWFSADGGANYTQSILARDVETVGPVVFAGPSTLYGVYQDSDRNVSVATTTNGGGSWTNSIVAQNVEARGYPVIAADDGGNIYVAWATFSTLPVPCCLRNVRLPTDVGRIMLSRSSDGGATWSVPVAVSDPAREATSPWLAAGASGRIAVAYYSAEGAGVTTLGTPVTTWNVEVAESIDATSASPAFTFDTVASLIFSGSPPGNFFQMDVDDAGNLYVAYPKDTNPPLVGVEDLMLAVQTGGQKLR